MSVKVLAGFAAALVVTTVGVFAAGGSSMFDSCGKSGSTCPLSAMMSSSSPCCAHEAEAATVPVSCANPDALGACAGGSMAAATPEASTPGKGKACCTEE